MKKNYLTSIFSGDNRKKTTPKAVEVIEATHITLENYAKTFKDLARYDRREAVFN